MQHESLDMSRFSDTVQPAACLSAKAGINSLDTITFLDEKKTLWENPLNKTAIGENGVNACGRTTA